MCRVQPFGKGARQVIAGMVEAITRIWEGISSMQRSFVQSVVLFIALALAAAVLLVAAGAVGDSFARAALLAVGAALLGAGLTVFLLRATAPVAA